MKKIICKDNISPTVFANWPQMKIVSTQQNTSVSACVGLHMDGAAQGLLKACSWWFLNRHLPQKTLKKKSSFKKSTGSGRDYEETPLIKDNSVQQGWERCTSKAKLRQLLRVMGQGKGAVGQQGWQQSLFQPSTVPAAVPVGQRVPCPQTGCEQARSAICHLHKKAANW